MRVTKQSYGKKLISSVVGAILGIVLFLGSFVVLYINEGRENIGKVAKDVQEITQSTQGVENGSLICLKGFIEATTYASDEYIMGSDYLVLKRNVEMYGYVETKHSKSKDNLGGSTTTTETYTYELKWTDDPKKTNTFQGDNSEIPKNIPQEYNSWVEAKPSSKESKATGLSIGGYAVSNNVEISGEYKLELNINDINIEQVEGAIINNDYIYKSNSEEFLPNKPNIGDIRISYHVAKKTDKGIIFGELNGDKISSYVTPKNNTLYRFFVNVDSKDMAISILVTEHKTMTWILRIVGWLLMFVGLVAMSGPATKFLSVIPVFSKASKFLFGVAAFFISLILTTIIVLLSMILHNFWLAIAFVIVLIVIIVLVIKNKHNKVAEKPRR